MSIIGIKRLFSTISSYLGLADDVEPRSFASNPKRSHFQESVSHFRSDQAEPILPHPSTTTTDSHTGSNNYDQSRVLEAAREDSQAQHRTLIYRHLGQFFRDKGANGLTLAERNLVLQMIGETLPSGATEESKMLRRAQLGLSFSEESKFVFKPSQLPPLPEDTANQPFTIPKRSSILLDYVKAHRTPLESLLQPIPRPTSPLSHSPLHEKGAEVDSDILFVEHPDEAEPTSPARKRHRVLQCPIYFDPSYDTEKHRTKSDQQTKKQIQEQDPFVQRIREVVIRKTRGPSRISIESRTQPPLSKSVLKTGEILDTRAKTKLASQKDILTSPPPIVTKVAPVTLPEIQRSSKETPMETKYEVKTRFDFGTPLSAESWEKPRSFPPLSHAIDLKSTSSQSKTSEQIPNLEVEKSIIASKAASLFDTKSSKPVASLFPTIPAAQVPFPDKPSESSTVSTEKPLSFTLPPALPSSSFVFPSLQTKSDSDKTQPKQTEPITPIFALPQTQPVPSSSLFSKPEPVKEKVTLDITDQHKPSPTGFVLPPSLSSGTTQDRSFGSSLFTPASAQPKVDSPSPNVPDTKASMFTFPSVQPKADMFSAPLSKPESRPTQSSLFSLPSTSIDKPTSSGIPLSFNFGATSTQQAPIRPPTQPTEDVEMSMDESTPSNMSTSTQPSLVPQRTGLFNLPPIAVSAPSSSTPTTFTLPPLPQPSSVATAPTFNLPPLVPNNSLFTFPQLGPSTSISNQSPLSSYLATHQPMQPSMSNQQPITNQVPPFHFQPSFNSGMMDDSQQPNNPGTNNQSTNAPRPPTASMMRGTRKPTYKR